MSTPATSCCAPPEHLASAIAFPSNMRPHISVNVTDIAGVRPFYAALFGIEPVKERADYIKWEPISPPVNFTLNLHPPALASAEELGIEVDVATEAEAIASRLRAVGVEVTQGDNVYRASDKAGNRWEISVRSADH